MPVGGGDTVGEEQEGAVGLRPRAGGDATAVLRWVIARCENTRRIIVDLAELSEVRTDTAQAG